PPDARLTGRRRGAPALLRGRARRAVRAHPGTLAPDRGAARLRVERGVAALAPARAGRLPARELPRGPRAPAVGRAPARARGAPGFRRDAERVAQAPRRTLLRALRPRRGSARAARPRGRAPRDRRASQAHARGREGALEEGARGRAQLARAA